MVSLSDALTREHRDIDGGIEAFVADLDRDVVTPEPLRGRSTRCGGTSTSRRSSCSRRSARRACSCRSW
ncbi:hypothetical protein [Pseudolysinimonas kribbensis]|uniref:hypothetical protein n=1 Tax=Pseudolysinimonas kribbensis TaxID=433641 RepID=UPI0024E10B02|nr:hypothetical protein [Pseudolysinimonas kribbensis]